VRGGAVVERGIQREEGQEMHSHVTSEALSRAFKKGRERAQRQVMRKDKKTSAYDSNDDEKMKPHT
jgi:hypothetical protein